MYHENANDFAILIRIDIEISVAKNIRNIGKIPDISIFFKNIAIFIDIGHFPEISCQYRGFFPISIFVKPCQTIPASTSTL